MTDPSDGQLMENILLVWALRHPACGYVQGMNDLLVPFIYVNMTEYTCLRGASDAQTTR